MVNKKSKKHRRSNKDTVSCSTVNEQFEEIGNHANDDAIDV